MESATTSNGYTIERPVDKMSAESFRRRMVEDYGMDGENPKERLGQLKQLSVEGIAILLEDINKSVQGSEESLMAHEKTMKIGNTETLKPDDRYDVFIDLVNNIKATGENINPARVADALALGVILLHPFHDGNGRTARALGLLFRDSFDSKTDDYESDYATVVEPRDEARARGSFLIYGYTPVFQEGFDQSDPNQVKDYLHKVLTDESEGAYYSCFGDAEPLYLDT